MNNQPILLPIGSVNSKTRELYAYLVANVLQRNHQPTLYSIALFMRLDCDTAMRMLSELQHFGLIRYSTTNGLRAEILGGGKQMKFMGEVE